MRPVALLSSIVALCVFSITPAIATESDFNADRSSDVLFQNQEDGRLLIWTMNNFVRSVQMPQSLATGWDVVGKGDFNGDGTSDILYLKDDGTTAIAGISKAARSTLTFPGGVKPVWGVHGVGDFNGDGTDDILWRRSSDGVTMIWGVVNSLRSTVTYPGGLANFWDIVGIGDFDNDGTDDILCQHNSDGRLLIWKMNNYGRASVKLPQSLAKIWTVVGVGDFNADGTDDVLYRKDTGDTAVAEFNTLNRSTLKFPGGIGLPWSVKDIGDYDGDGTDDIFFQRGSDSVTLAWGIKNSARAKIAWPGGLATQWIVRGASFFVGGPPVFTLYELTRSPVTISYGEDNQNATTGGYEIFYLNINGTGTYLNEPDQFNNYNTVPERLLNNWVLDGKGRLGVKFVDSWGAAKTWTVSKGHGSHVDIQEYYLLTNEPTSYPPPGTTVALSGNYAITPMVTDANGALVPLKKPQSGLQYHPTPVDFIAEELRLGTWRYYGETDSFYITFNSGGVGTWRYPYTATETPMTWKIDEDKHLVIEDVAVIHTISRIAGDNTGTHVLHKIDNSTTDFTNWLISDQYYDRSPDEITMYELATIWTNELVIKPPALLTNVGGFLGETVSSTINLFPNGRGQIVYNAFSSAFDADGITTVEWYIQDTGLFVLVETGTDAQQVERKRTWDYHFNDLKTGIASADVRYIYQGKLYMFTYDGYLKYPKWGTE